MHSKRILSCILTYSIMASAISFNSITTSAIQQDIVIQPRDKITNLLSEKICNSSDESIPVVLWLNKVDDSEIESKIEEKIGYNIESLEVNYSAPSEELINELSKAANGEPDTYLDFLMKRHLDLTASERNAEKERTDLYQKTKIEVLREINTAASEQLLDKIGIADSKIGFVSSYAPMIVCEIPINEINSIAELDEISEIDYYTPIKGEDCSINFGTTKNTVGINKINNLIGLTGSGVNIGIYETCTVSSQYYSLYDLNTSQVSIIGPSYNNGSDHSTYCAGVAAGSNGIAPSANIYSATCEYDWQSFDWNNYSNAQMSNLEALLASDVDLVSISWGSNNFIDCYNYWSKYTDYLIEDTSKTIVCATGNNYNDYVINPSSAYNCIAVNGFIDTYNNQAQELLNDYSYDHGNGCFKPDVIGPSLNNGTSTATPYIAGMIALMYQYKPSLAARPELTKAILMASCHRKCSKVLINNSISNINEPMTEGLSYHQGAGIPDMYRMISIVAQHTYGNGVLSSNNSFERRVNIVQPSYNSEYVNFTMAYLQTNVPSGSVSGTIDDYDFSVTNNGSTYYSNKSKSSTEVIYKSLTSDPNYEMRIYKYSGNSDYVRYGYAWSTDNERYFNTYGEEGVYYLKNYKSSYYLSRNTVNDKAYQTSFSNSLNNLWVLDSLSSNSNSYALQNANILSNGLGLGSIISGTSYYALEGSGASVSSISVTYDAVTGTYTFKRSVNGLTYALGINNQSTSTGEFASWSPYSANNASQKWYLETANYRSGDADYDGTITQYDKTIVQQYLLNLYSLINNLQKYLFDANRDNSIDMADVLTIGQMV
ncbi:S8 family serine peptidase [Ruminococcus sp.]|uniref:S8 family serine peptidase n=1 Tax=Ruminococcus sp. TaxID=41978 RepID=UPI001B50CBD1|nr:S8 family serine peptidase [Ruminococcus sp.]MBP5431936.1 S8 family serine peptidase [Ruminococcus sp.]